MGICRWEWFDFRRLPFEDAFLNRRTGRSRSRSRRSCSREFLGWEWFDFRRLPFEDAFLNRRTSRSRRSSRRKQKETGENKEKVAKISSFSIGFRSYIREFLGAILMLFRPSLPWGFAAGSGSILGDSLLKIPFWTEEIAGSRSRSSSRRKQEETGGKSS